MAAAGGVGAGDGVRTRDTELGKLVLYQLSYARSKNIPMIRARSAARKQPADQPRMMESTSSRRRSMSDSVYASRFSLSSGSVFEPRTLKCQSS